MSEILVFFRGGTTVDALGLDTIHRSSPRLAVVDAHALQAPAMTGASTSFVALHGTDQIPQDMVDELTAEEHLFAQSWLLRQSSRPTERAGDGADWDAAGFDAPDPPNPSDAQG